MAKVAFRLKGAKEKVSIYVNLSLGRGKQYERKTGFTIDPKKWSDKNGLPKTRNVSAEIKKMTATLQKLSNYLYEQSNKANEQGDEIDGKWLQYNIDVYFGKIDETGVSNKVIDHINEIIRTANTRENSKGGIGLSKDRIQKYGALAKTFSEFQGTNTYKIKDLSKIQFEKFRTWLLDVKKYAPSTALKKVSDLKCVCFDAEGRGIEVSPTLRSVKVGTVKTYDKEYDVITLTMDEIEKIESLLLTRKALINARKWLIIACFTGQRGGDLLQLTKADFRNTSKGLIIQLTQGKGNKPVIIPVHPKAQRIYNDGFPSPISLQRLNDHLKELGQLAELNTPTMGRKQEKTKAGKRGILKERPKWEYLNTHTGRRTFATYWYGKLPTPQIMAVTGHKKESTFLQYINKSESHHVEAFFKEFEKENIQLKATRGGKYAINE